MLYLFPDSFGAVLVTCDVHHSQAEELSHSNEKIIRVKRNSLKEQADVDTQGKH